MATANHLYDSMPDSGHFSDDGCNIAPHCLECPLPLCRFDMPPKVAGGLMKQATVQRLLAAGLTEPQVCEEMGLSARQVHRLKRAYERGRQ